MKRRCGAAVILCSLIAQAAAAHASPVSKTHADDTGVSAALNSGDITHAVQILRGIKAADRTRRQQTALALWATANGDDTTARDAMTQLPTQTQSRVETVANSARQGLTRPIARAGSTSAESGTSVVILGYGLESDGTMRRTLIERLRTGANIAQASSAAEIIVTGGNPQAGVTEAAQMAQWLHATGNVNIPIRRETDSMSTQSNARNVTPLLAPRTRAVTLVTSSDHARRATADFLAAGINITTTVASDNRPIPRPSPRQTVAVYRDAAGTADLTI